MENNTLVKKLIVALLFVCLLMPCLVVYSQNLQEQKTIISVERIWDRAGHNAFTSLIRFNGRFYCAFRESSGHVPGLNGSIRVIASEDGQNWTSVAHVYKKGVDLRDPMLSVTPDQRIMLSMGGSIYEQGKLLGLEPCVSFSDREGKNFSSPQNLVIDQKVKTGRDWLWRVTWHNGTAYGVVYQAGKAKDRLHLLKTKDGVHYDFVTTLDVPGNTSETTLRFTTDDQMIALVRRDGGNSRNAYIGVSSPPYIKWTWHELNARLGGPDFLILPQSGLLCGTRLYQLNYTDQMALAKVTTDGKFIKLVTLPSGGDCSYPGLVVHDGVLYVSYYSSHEEKTSIYFARLWLDELEYLMQQEPTPEPFVKQDKNGHVALACPASDAEIHYTMDGTIPTQHSPLYQKPLTVSHTVSLKMVAFQPDKLPSSVVSVTVGTDVYQKAREIKASLLPGLVFRYYEGEVRGTKEIEKLPLKKSGTTPRFSIAPRQREEDFALVFNGYLNIPQDGLYTFYLKSNDGSRLYLNDAELINNDGAHIMLEKSAATSLHAGLHKITLKYFQLGGNHGLKLFWKGPGFEKTEVPATVLFHSKAD